MANLPESSTFDAGVYQLELSDPVIGGPSGVSNAPLKNLANRTRFLKDQVDALASSVGTALDGKQPQDATLTALSGLVTSADKMIYSTAADIFAVTPLSAFARSVLDDADAATMRATIGAAANGRQSYTANGIFTVPAGVSTVYVTVVGGGGGGAGAHISAPYTPGGGGAGGVRLRWPVSVTPGQSISVTIGQGGAGGLGSAQGGSLGGSTGGGGGGVTSFGSLLSISGGGGARCTSGDSSGGGRGSPDFAGDGGNGDTNSGIAAGGAGGANIFSAPSFCGHGPRPAALYGGGGGGGRAAGYWSGGESGAPGICIVEW